MAGEPGYRLYVIDSSITGRLRAAVQKAIERSAPPGSHFVDARSFQHFLNWLGELSKPEKIAQLGRIKDTTVIAHGSHTGFFYLGGDLAGPNRFQAIARPFDAFDQNARVDVIRCTHIGTLYPTQQQVQSSKEDRLAFYQAIGSSLLPKGGRVSGTADDAYFSDGGGVRLTKWTPAGSVPVGGRYPTQYHSLELLKQKPQEFWAYTTHTVRYGDRVWYLAEDYGYRNRQGFTDDVRDLNPGVDFERLRPGQVIRVPTRVGKPASLSTPYALRGRAASAGASTGLFAAAPSPLQTLTEQLNRTRGAGRAITPAASSLDLLRRLEAESAAHERTQRWLQGVQQQLNRRTLSGALAGSQAGTLSNLQRLSQHLERTAGTATRMPTFDTMSTLKRLEKEAAQREQTQRWLDSVRVGLDRRPLGGLAAGSRPSTLSLLNEHLRRTSAEPYRLPEFDTMATLRRLEREAADRQATDRWLRSIQQQLDRRPGAGYPSTLTTLKQHLNRF